MISGKLSCELVQRFATACLLLVAGCLAYLFLTPAMLALCWAGLFLLILVGEWPAFHAWALTLVYPGLPMMAVVLMHLYAPRWVATVSLVLASAADTGGLLVGKLWGAHKIAPTISPQKSWEGLVGSYVCALIAARMMFAKYGILLSFAQQALLVLCAVIAALAGDLFESYLKRRVGLKDSGTLLPGHGGLLDRFDSLFGVAPMMLAWYLLQ